MDFFGRIYPKSWWIEGKWCQRQKQKYWSQESGFQTLPSHHDDKDLADDEITEKISQLDERVRSLNQRRAHIRNEPAEEPQIVDMVEVIDGDQGDEEDEEDEELAEENQAANGEDNN